MDDRALRDLMMRVARLEREAVRYRQGIVADTAPLDVQLGGATVSYEDVSALDSPAPLVDNDVVATLTFGNDLLVLGRIGDGLTGPPPGLMFAYGGSTAPEGFLLCDGSNVSRTTYARLFAVLSTTYGAGNGSTTFGLPDLRGRVPMGVDGAAGRIASNDALGNSGGAATHTLTAAESGLRDHTHDLDYNTRFVPGNAGLGTMNTYETPMVGLADSSTNGVEGGAVSGSAHNNLQPYQVVNWIVKT